MWGTFTWSLVGLKRVSIQQLWNISNSFATVNCESCLHPRQQEEEQQTPFLHKTFSNVWLEGIMDVWIRHELRAVFSVRFVFFPPTVRDSMFHNDWHGVSLHPVSSIHVAETLRRQRSVSPNMKWMWGLTESCRVCAWVCESTVKWNSFCVCLDVIFTQL